MDNNSCGQGRSLKDYQVSSKFFLFLLCDTFLFFSYNPKALIKK